MRLRHLVVAVVLTAPAVRADVTTLTLPSSNFNVTAGSPVSQTVTGVPAINNLLGFSLAANWTAVSGDPWSSELLVGYTRAGGSAVTPAFYGGAENGNPYTFPGTSFLSNSYAFGPTPVNAPAGNYTFTFDQDFTGSTANLASATVRLYSNPSVATGNTTGGPTAARPNNEGSAVSAVGTAVPYTTHTMTVNAAGRYMLALSGFDTFISVYGPGGYTPATPLANLIATNDDSYNLAEGAASVITLDLATGTNYTVVVTGYANTDFGAYSLYGAGPGTVTFTPVPEPVTVFGIAALAGLAGVGVRRLRRRTA